MGTRGAFGVIIGEQEKIGYNQFDSYPDYGGIQVLKWLRDADLDEVRKLAEAAQVVDNDRPPTPEEIAALKASTDLSVSEQSTDDWYCLTRETHGSIEAMLKCGFILDSHTFPLDSLFCEWAYIVDLDRNNFEVYKGFQKKLPKKGRWKGRPTKAEDEANYAEHVKWCSKNDREPWLPMVSEYKAVELVASWRLYGLPSDEEFLGFFDLRAAQDTLENVKDYPQDVANVVNRIVEEKLDEQGMYAADWAALEEAARDALARHSSPARVTLLERSASQD